MNRNSSPRSNAVEDKYDQSSEKLNNEEGSSEDMEELKSQTTKRGQTLKPGLYISLTSVQAYSIMKNIPKRFRLIEKVQTRKPTNKSVEQSDGSPEKKKSKKDMI